MAVSNNLYVDVYEQALDDSGWEVHVIAYGDYDRRQVANDLGHPLAIIPRYVEVMISPGISDPTASASVTMDLDDPFWEGQLTDGTPALDLLENEHLWQVYENGVMRAEFLAQDIQETFLDESETRAVIISGPLGHDVLRWGVVMTPHYPYGSPNPDDPASGMFQFANLPLMACWLQLLDAAKARGTVRFVTPTFTATTDSAGQPWQDAAVPPANVPGQASAVLQADVNFSFDSATLTSAAIATLTTLTAQFVGSAPQVTIVGHTDSTGTTAYNQTLSQNRANAVATKIAQLLPAAVLHTSGVGESQPVATNATTAGRASNRRVTITYPNSTVVTTTRPVFTPTLGQDMFSLLREVVGEDLTKAAPIRAEWLMLPNFRLDVRRQFGQRRDADVIFFEGSTHMITKERARSRGAIANLVAQQDDSGNYAVATDGASTWRWRQREMYVRDNNVYDTAVKGQIAQARLEMAREEKSSWTIKVPPYSPGRRIFEDYTFGDWIGISRFRGGQQNTVEPFRVMSCTLRVDKNAKVDLELTLSSRFDARTVRLQDQITSLLNAYATGPRTFIQDLEPANAKVGDLWTPRTAAS